MPSRTWPLAAVLGVQLAIVAAIPFRTMVTRAEGVDVTLRTMPVDPFDPLSGYYVTLTYEAERPPSSALSTFAERDDVWVTVHRAEPAWTPVSVTADRPPPQPDEISLRATWDGRRAEIVNAGRVYIPETERDNVDRAMRDVDRRALVDLRVSADGDVAVLRLRAGEKTFGESR